jgi:hypothetical protein
MGGFFRFALKVVVAHTVSYFVVGSVAYLTLTREFYEGSRPLFAGFMRTPADPALWAHPMRWFLPAQVARGLILAAVIWPFVPTLRAWRLPRRAAALAGLYLGIGFWAAAVAAPGTLEGFVYLRPEIDLRAQLMVQPEILAQGSILAGWLAWWMGPRQAGEPVKAAPADPNRAC